MRNEGLFILEWLAAHRLAGFDHVVIATNDCTDGSDVLLDLLQQQGLLTHLSHSPEPGQPVQDSGMATMMTHLRQTDAEWVLHIDADEFLCFAPGQKLDDLLIMGAGADAIGLPWRMFGDNGHRLWPGATLPHFTRCENAPHAGTTKFKTMFRLGSFGHGTDHMPCLPLIADPVVISAAGEPLDPGPLTSARHHSRYGPLDRACGRARPGSTTTPSVRKTPFRPVMHAAAAMACSPASTSWAAAGTGWPTATSGPTTRSCPAGPRSRPRWPASGRCPASPRPKPPASRGSWPNATIPRGQHRQDPTGNSRCRTPARGLALNTHTGYHDLNHTQSASPGSLTPLVPTPTRRPSWPNSTSS